MAFASRDGVTLSGIHRTVEGTPKAAIVLAHGIMTDKDFRGFHPALAAELAGHGFETLRFDFRGHGESGGTSEQVTIAGEIQDLAAAVRFLQRRHAARVGVVGTSLGAGVAVLYAAKARRPPFALVLLSAVLNFRRTFVAPETAWGKRWFTPEAFAKAKATGTLDVGDFRIGRGLIREFKTLHPAKVLRKLNLPVLMIHGDHDPVAPFGAAREAATSAPAVDFVPIRGPGHYFEGSEARVFRHVSTWLGARVPA